MILKIKYTHSVIFTSLFVIGLFASQIIFVESYALPLHHTFDTASQPYCFFEDAEFDVIPIDGITFQEQTIRQMLNLAADHISDQTIMRFIELGCDVPGNRIGITTNNEIDIDLDATVVEFPIFAPDFCNPYILQSSSISGDT